MDNEEPIKFKIPSTIGEACHLTTSEPIKEYERLRAAERELKRITGGPYSELALALAELDAVGCS